MIKMAKFTTYVFVQAMLIGFVIIGTLFWVHRTLQNSFMDFYAVKDPRGIEVLEAFKVGGLDQWLHIRGRSRNNPVLLFVHGGPGASNIGSFDSIQRPWEDYFTVVQWDQRQAGKSYYPDIGHTLSKEQYMQDLEEVVAHLRHRFKKEKIFLRG